MKSFSLERPALYAEERNDKFALLAAGAAVVEVDAHASRAAGRYLKQFTSPAFGTDKAARPSTPP